MNRSVLFAFGLLFLVFLGCDRPSVVLVPLASSRSGHFTFEDPGNASQADNLRKLHNAMAMVMNRSIELSVWALPVGGRIAWLVYLFNESAREPLTVDPSQTWVGIAELPDVPARLDLESLMGDASRARNEKEFKKKTTQIISLWERMNPVNVYPLRRYSTEESRRWFLLHYFARNAVNHLWTQTPPYVPDGTPHCSEKRTRLEPGLACRWTVLSDRISSGVMSLEVFGTRPNGSEVVGQVYFRAYPL